MSKLIVLRGIPASGKSTWAVEYAKKNSLTTIVINRDALRKMCGVYWVANREPLIKEMEDNLVTIALEADYDVIVDATNLNQSAIDRWKTLLKEGDEMEIKTFDISLNKAIFRDWKRGLMGGHKVGRKVVKDFYESYKTIKIVE